jgi:hypothetical protein
MLCHWGFSVGRNTDAASTPHQIDHLRNIVEKQDEIEVEYEVWVDDGWEAGSNNLDEAMKYAWQYLEEGDVRVIEVTRKVITTLKASRRNI